MLDTSKTNPIYFAQTSIGEPKTQIDSCHSKPIIMAALPYRPQTRRHHDVPSRSSINDESADDFRPVQQHLPPWQPSQLGDSSTALHPDVLHKTQTLGYPNHSAGHPDTLLSAPLPRPLNRASSFESLSTLHRQQEAAALSLYRDSPISAIGRPLVSGPDLTYELPHRRQSWHTATFEQQARQQKLIKKSLKKEQKDRVRALKDAEKQRRAFLVAEVAAARRTHGVSRANSDPTKPRTAKMFAADMVQKLNLNRSLSLKRPFQKGNRNSGKHGSKSNSVPTTLEHCTNKEEVRQYFNSLQPRAETAGLPAELPAELPQYTKFQDDTSTQDNKPLTLVDDIPKPTSRTTPAHNQEHPNLQTTRRTTTRCMRCDKCDNPIRQNQVYYHCSICNDGDRMLCHSCDRAGESCRHPLAEIVRSVSKAQPNSTSARGQSAVRQSSASRRSGPDAVIEASSSAGVYSTHLDMVEDEHQKPALNRTKDLREDNEEHELELRRREQDVVYRERDVVLRERSAALREQQASLREQESALSARQQAFNLQLQAALAQTIPEAATGVGAQFPDWESSSAVRMHANKRKSRGASNTITRDSSSSSNQKSSLRGVPPPNDEDENGQEENGSGSPKKIKQDPDASLSPEKLFACPYCKYDKSRYSEANFQEKHYRGCASGFWKDPSRLKQHLYRVHCRRLQCPRCWSKFDNKDDLDRHMLEPTACPLAECPCPEKFGDAEFIEIHRKRPAMSSEDVWFTIYGILFPGQPLPSSPYAEKDDVATPAAPTPTSPDWRDTLENFRHQLEARLDQQATPIGEDVRQVIRDTMQDMLRQLTPTTGPSPAFSYSAAPVSTSGRRSSISLTPYSSTPPSPGDGFGLGAGDMMNIEQLGSPHTAAFSALPISTLHEKETTTIANNPSLWPHDHQNFNAVLPSSSTKHDGPTASSHRARAPTGRQPHFLITDFGRAAAKPGMAGPEDDQCSDECHSWSHGDELGLAVPTGENTDRICQASPANDAWSQMPFWSVSASTNSLVKFTQGTDMGSGNSMLQPLDGVGQGKGAQRVNLKSSPKRTRKPQSQPFDGVKDAQSNATAAEITSTTTPADSITCPPRPKVRLNHSTTASLDSGYGSMSRRAQNTSSKTRSFGPSRTEEADFVIQDPGMIKSDDIPSLPSPVSDSDMNLDALDIPYQQHLGEGLDMEPDDCGNIGGQWLSEYPSARLPALTNDHWMDPVSPS
ncbi:hypothetical protein PV10_06962 [Exophiala mesophila]|uniref:C2H2-type domain-containing protein n=1 Tax=Exophiala mesophila TaxID=212818 RepID=A0A0D1ZS37_EXOME|nr:uncharacterized protein PV10_06962 [Exophiala mesophila]KIV89573.1 hypothetical protein PV10_06962 [Exophiala mesophila]